MDHLERQQATLINLIDSIRWTGYGGFMEVTFQIPDELASSITAAGDLSRRALEAFGLEELRVGRITELELRKILGLERVEMDGFLKSHGIYHGYTLDEVNRQVEAMERLGF